MRIARINLRPKVGSFLYPLAAISIGGRMKRKHIQVNMMNSARNIFIVVLVLCSQATTCLAQAKNEKPIVAVVTDKDGLSTTVTGLLAHYEYTEQLGVTNMVGQVTGTALKTHKSEFPTLSMRIKEGPVYFNEDISFGEIKKIEAADWGSSTPTPKRFLIEKKDGSSILISYDEKSKVSMFEERNNQNGLKSQFKIAFVWFQSSGISLLAFTGRAKASGGKEGDFSIPYGDIRSIVFQ
jgi:hypothetical protein